MVPLNVRIPITVERIEMSNLIKKFVGTSSNTSSSRMDEQLRQIQENTQKFENKFQNREALPFGDQIKFGSYFPIFNILTFPLITNSPQLFNITTPTFEILLWPISKLIFKFFVSFFLNDHYTLMLIPPSPVSINYHFLF